MAAKEFFHNPEGISIESMDFDDPEIHGDTFIFDGLVFQVIDHLKQTPTAKVSKKCNHRRQIENFQDHVDICTAEEMYTFFCRAVSIIAATMLSD